jgi:signal-transduction protein with cAMP-binding, CBS, and nucleotidyltransferase domain
MRVADACIYEVATCLPGVTARDLARVMRDRQIGYIVVVQPCEGGEMAPVGMVTDRDLAIRMVADGGDASTLTAGDLMHAPVATVLETDSIHDAIRRMARLGISRLPVVNASRHVIGIVMANDLVRVVAEDLCELARINPRRIEVAQAAAPGPLPCHWPPRQ